MAGTTDLRIQVLSDLHLEKPSAYDIFDITPAARHLALLGDIGEARDDALYEFLRHQLQKFETVFFLLGNREPYHISWASAMSRLRDFEKSIQEERRECKSLGAFVLLDKTRFDFSSNLTILGCTLHSRVTPEQRDHVSFGLNDFYHIKDWTVEDHTAAHAKEVAWLNGQVSALHSTEPNRQIIIFTHHSPTSDPISVDPKNARIARSRLGF